MITATTIAVAWLAQLTADAQLAAWCQLEFGNPLKLYRGESPQHMRDPGVGIPFIIVDVLHNRKGAIKDYQFMLLCIMGITAPEDQDPDFDVLATLAPLEQDFAAHVLRVLRASNQDICFDLIEVDIEDAFDPQFRAEMTITVSVPRAMVRGAY